MNIKKQPPLPEFSPEEEDSEKLRESTQPVTTDEEERDMPLLPEEDIYKKKAYEEPRPGEGP